MISRQKVINIEMAKGDFPLANDFTRMQEIY